MTELNIEYVGIDDIFPYEKNARKHTPESIEAIKASIQAFGFNDPIGVWYDTIVEGHGRYFAAKQLGFQQVPVIRLDELTDEQRRAYALAHNRTAELSEWEYDIVLAELKEIQPYADLTGFHFNTEFDWDNVPDLSDVEYQEPTLAMMTCPCCGHVDRRVHFKKVRR